MLSQSPNTPEAKQAEGGAGRVEQDIPDTGLPGRDKGLVKLVARSIERREGQHEAGFRPAPGSVARYGLPAQRAPEQQGQCRIFS